MGAASKDYPALTVEWVRNRTRVSDIELLLANELDLIKYDVEIKEMSSWSDMRSEITRISGNKQALEKLCKKYFCLLLLNLYEQFFVLSMPRRALEFLVLEFIDISMTDIGEGTLPTLVAGISEPNCVGFSISEFRTDIRIHNAMSPYILSILDLRVLQESPLF